MAKKPKKVPSVQYGTSGFGPYWDEVNAVSSRQRSRDSAARASVGTDYRPSRSANPNSPTTVLGHAVGSALNAVTGYNRRSDAADRAISNSAKAAKLGRKQVDQRYGVSSKAKKKK